MVIAGGPLLIRDWMRQVRHLGLKHSIDIIWVTSGAIATAAERTRFGKAKKALPEKQALSAIGQPLIMDTYLLALQAQGAQGAQILLTYEDLADRERRTNFQNTVNTLLRWGATPILNENDAVATQEIRFGDNDRLSAKVAIALGAERLVILTDVEGLYDSDPRKNPGARLIGVLEGVGQTQLSRVGAASGSSRGTGGMLSKLKAGQEASKKGIETWLVKGDITQVLFKIQEDAAVGTRIKPKGKR
jgi:glutamate 5-kinase